MSTHAPHYSAHRATGVMALLTVFGGLLAGLVGMAMTVFIHALEAVAITDNMSLLRTIAAPAIGGAVAGIGWWMLRTTGEVRTVKSTLKSSDSLPINRTLTDAFLQLIVVGSGMSLGRENAPRQTSAAMTDRMGTFTRLEPTDRAILLASAAGAGLGAVYNVPVAGALFSLEVLGLARRKRSIVVAVVMSCIATATAWPIIGWRAVYDFPEVLPNTAVLFWASLWVIFIVPCAWLVGESFFRAAQHASAHQPRRYWLLPLSIAAVGAIVGAIAYFLPEITGNGFKILELGFAESGTWQVFLVLMLIKPLATVLCLRSGAVGGTLTPALATGASLGGCVALLLHEAGVLGLQDGVSLATFVLIGASAVLAVTQRAPFFAALITWELTKPELWTLPFLLLAAIGARYFALWVPAVFSWARTKLSSR